MNNIAVCIPTFNRPQELGALLASIPEGISTFVSDNGALLPPEFLARFPRVVFKQTPGTPVPMFANWNVAARMGDAEWLVVPSDDDIYYPGSFDVIANALRQCAGAGIVIFGHHVVGESYEILSTWKPEAASMRAPLGFEPFKFGVDARMPSIVIRRSAMEQLGFFDERFVCTASDSDLVQRALLAFDAAYVPEVVSGYRVWQGSATRSTLASEGWLRDVDHWGTKIASLMRGAPRYAREAGRVRDELHALNLLAGLRLLCSQGQGAECRAHFRRSRYPARARLGTQLRLLHAVARASLR